MDIKARTTVSRPATWEDAAPLARTLARAYFDDPLIRFFIPDDRRREAKLPGLFKLLFEVGLPNGPCYVTNGCESVALWRSPNQWRIPIRDYMTNGPELLNILGVAGVVRVMGAMNFIDHRHPKQPHFYLQAIGTDPANQGEGFAAALIRRQLAKADDLGVPCYLESTKESNIPIYAHFGFKLAGEIRIPGGPAIHPMWRQPDSSVFISTER
jgi:GNAT superfamily N-acetyltransferase